MPTIAQAPVGTLVHRAAYGHPVTPRIAVNTLAHHTAGVLRSPRHVAGIVRRSRALDRVYHRTVAPALGVAGYGRRVGPYAAGLAPHTARVGPYATRVGPYGTRVPIHAPRYAPRRSWLRLLRWMLLREVMRESC